MRLPIAVKPLLLAAALSVVGVASAANYVLPTTLGTGYYSVFTPTFTDTFSFNVSSLSTLSGNALSGFGFVGFPNGVNFPINPITFTELTVSGTGGFSQSFAAAGNSASFSIAGLSAGDYTLSVAGVLNSPIGMYSLQGNLAPVPEPETYAMFVAGLGIIGAVARRRRNRI